MDRSAYLSRIGVDSAELVPDAATLRMLQRKHLLAVPFENLDIHWGHPITLDTGAFYKKIVNQRRGGFCYELNGSFNELLRDIGFETRLISARVASGKDFTPEYDHAAIIATVSGEEYLTDVGFGAFSTEPLRFALDEEQADPAGTFAIRRSHTDGYFVVSKFTDGVWTSEYMFQPTGRDLSEFGERCDFQQYSPDSHFKKGKLISILLESGRKTLTDKNFVVTKNGVRNEIALTSEDQFHEILAREFGAGFSRNNN
jgi:N-hydroxyarylamine O-acetyltransferase